MVFGIQAAPTAKSRGSFLGFKTTATDALLRMDFPDWQPF
jgi:hypothetical protein